MIYHNARPTVEPSLDWLSLNLQPEEIDWKIQSVSKGDKPKTLIVPYIDNRAVMDRLDQAFGSMNWSNRFVAFNGGFICSITVKFSDGKEVTKSDGANATDIEPVKGGISDAMKRTAVQYGIGRNLYNYPKVYLMGDFKYIPEWAHRLLHPFVIKFNGGGLDKEVYFFTEDMVAKLR